MIKGIFWGEAFGREEFDDLAVGGYNTTNFTEEELEELASEWRKETPDNDYWVADWQKG